MQLHGNTILITGGATGIGLAFAKRFVALGNEVIVCGRRDEALDAAKVEVPGLHTRRCDLAEPAEREALFGWARDAFPALNVLVNNAGIQRRISLLESEAWEHTAQEIAINLEAPVHLCRLLAPFLQEQSHPAILNVTSGLSFAPYAAVPVYCATKAALHSFTLSLRHQLHETPVEVIEIIPPAVNTDLGGKGLHDFGASVDDFCEGIMEGLRAGQLEIAYGTAAPRARASRDELDASFAQMNAT